MYQTGSATGVNDLLNQFVTFCEANGWTRDSLGDESTGRRWHAHRGSQYVNFRTFIAEAISTEIHGVSFGTRTGLAFNVGTGYSGATAWYKQAGTPQDSGSKWFTAGMSEVTSSIPAYHFFAHNSGDQIYAVVEIASGQYNYFGFGQAVKYGAYTGGDFFFATGTGVEMSVGRGAGFFLPSYSGFGEPSSAQYNASFFKVDVDGENGWKVSGCQTTSAASRKVMDKYHDVTLTGIYTQPNTLNSLSVLLPVIPMVWRGTLNDTTVAATPLGEIPKIFYCNNQVIASGQQITLGSVDYRVFPFHKRGTSIEDIGTNTGYLGFAIEE